WAERDLLIEVGKHRRHPEYSVAVLFRCDRTQSTLIKGESVGAQILGDEAKVRFPLFLLISLADAVVVHAKGKQWCLQQAHRRCSHDATEEFKVFRVWIARVVRKQVSQHPPVEHHRGVYKHAKELREDAQIPFTK